MTNKMAELCVAVFFLLLAALVGWQVMQLPEPTGYARVGPRLFPGMIGTGLAICGVLLVWHALSGGFRNASHEGEGTAPDLRAFGWIAGAFVMFMLTVKPGGFVVAGTLLFAFGARGFGSQQLTKDLAIGLALALTAYLFFAKVLSVQLPAGLLGLVGL
jgi:putative tricarboxylic transport membrane protein